MSTDLYGIRVLEVDPPAKRMRLRVFVVYYDTQYKYHQPIPSDRSFFVRLLCDKDALGDDITETMQYDESSLNSNVFRYVDRFEELSRANDPITDYKDYSDFYYEHDGGWQDEDKLVQADYDLFVAKTEYLKPFAIGESWGTTSYQTESDGLRPEEYPLIPDFTDVYSFKPYADLDGISDELSLDLSEDGSKLLVVHDMGGFRVYSTSDWSKIGELLKHGEDEYPEKVVWGGNNKVAVQFEDGWAEIDYETGERSPLENAPRERDLRSSPDGAYTLDIEDKNVLVKEAESGRMLRRATRPDRIPTVALWSSDGKSVILAWMDDEGMNQRISVHLIGAAFEAWQRTGIPVPPRETRDITDLARLYAKVTDEFSSGWDSHIDDNLMDFHLTLARLGLDSNLVEAMREEPTKIAARAYEAVIAQKRGDGARATKSLEEALALLEKAEIEDWDATFVYAPLAGAHYIMGDAAAAETNLKASRKDITDEANNFQKRAIYCRALLVMERLTDIREIIQKEDPGGWVSDFHMRLLSDLADASQFSLLQLAFERWEPEYETHELVAERLLQLGHKQLVLESKWLFDDDEERADAIQEWLEKQTKEELTETDDPIAGLAAQGRWEQVYQKLSECEPTKREEHYYHALAPALARGDLDIALDLFGRFSYTDMNSGSLQTLKDAIIQLSKGEFREFHA